MNSKKVIGLIALIFVFVIACAGTSQLPRSVQLSEQDLILNPDEPWTGIWNAKLANGFEKKLVLKLKQNGNNVISAKGCTYMMSGTVTGSQLNGSYMSDTHNSLHRLNLVMSDDLKSFDGKEVLSVQDTYTLTGVRQE